MAFAQWLTLNLLTLSAPTLKKNVAYSKSSGKTIVANPKAEYKNVLPVVRGVGGTVLLITSPRIHLPRQ